MPLAVLRLIMPERRLLSPNHEIRQVRLAYYELLDSSD